MLGVLTVILIMAGCSMLAGAEEILTEAFSDPDWMNKEEKQ